MIIIRYRYIDFYARVSDSHLFRLSCNRRWLVDDNEKVNSVLDLLKLLDSFRITFNIHLNFYAFYEATVYAREI